MLGIFQLQLAAKAWVKYYKKCLVEITLVSQHNPIWFLAQKELPEFQHK